MEDVRRSALAKDCVDGELVVDDVAAPVPGFDRYSARIDRNRRNGLPFLPSL